MDIEQGGVPTVAVHTQPFSRLARSVARTNGMPTTRQAFVPQPVVNRTADELRAYIEGDDPVSKQPFVREVIEMLTEPLTDEDLTGLSFERTTPRLLEPDTPENLSRLFDENRWTDFLPVVLPTEERVEAMLAGTSHPPEEVVGRLRPTAYREFWEFTVEKVAVNAVMAGARPEYLPVILALAASGVTARSSSTTSFATISVVNGPIRGEIDMNAGIGAMGPYNHANATIGRAFGLLSQNLQGGSVPGETYMGTVGNPYAYTFCFPENEERSPWEPFHVGQGFDRGDSTVSAFLGGWYTISVYGPRETWQEKFRHMIAACEGHIPPMIAMDPLAAHAFADMGFDTKQQLLEWIVENCKVPAHEYWDDQWVQTLHRPHAVAGIEPFASRLKAGPDDLIDKFTADEMNIVVVGGETQGAIKMIAGRHRPSHTVRVDDWR